DIEAAVAEQPRHEDGDRDVVRVAARRRHRVAAHRDFGDVELGELEGAVERLLRLEIDRGDVAALDRGASVEDRAGAVVVADREPKLQWHVRLRKHPWRKNRPNLPIIDCPVNRMVPNALPPRPRDRSMKLPRFEYACPTTLSEAVALLASHDGE